MTNYSGSFDVYSPRWGHTDRYSLSFTSQGIEIKGNNFSATCSFPQGSDPVWSGYNEVTGNPLMNMFHNDSIYVSDVVVTALESAWQKWNDNTTTLAELQTGLDELFSWISETSEAKPHSQLWQGVF